MSSGAIEIRLPGDGKSELLPLSQANSFNVYRPEQMRLAAGDVGRITKNGHGFRNNELVTVSAIKGYNVTFTDGSSLGANGNMLHLDRGIAVTSRASQGKTIDNVIVSAPVEAFSQVNAAQFYVSMSLARQSRHLFTDSPSHWRKGLLGKWLFEGFTREKDR